VFQWNHATKLNGKIGVSVPQLCLKGSVHPSTFKSANLVPQLLFSGQAHPYAYVALHDGMRLMRKVIFTPKYFFFSFSSSQVGDLHIHFL
jgi:hypothetical protein